MKCHMFVGPTAFGISQHILDQTDLVVHEPASRGHLRALGRNVAPDECIALVDGRFGDVLSVAHWEILELLDAGVRVFGLSSMGAIRAAELHRFGMSFYGAVATQFVNDPNFSDDEVTLLHMPMPPYTPLSEPMVHLREAVNHLHGDGHLSSDGAARIISLLRARWFGDRTWEFLTELAAGEGVKPEVLSILFADPRRFRTKARDLESFLHRQAWML